jgi:hypothetical protein
MDTIFEECQLLAGPWYSRRMFVPGTWHVNLSLIGPMRTQSQTTRQSEAELGRPQCRSRQSIAADASRFARIVWTLPTKLR